MIDAAIASMYLFCLLRPVMLVALAPLALSLLLPGSFFGDEIVFTFCALSLTYAASSIMAAHMRQLTAAVALLLMAVYLLIFSFDSWINSDVETWIYNNHETVVFCLHIFIILSFSRRVQRYLARLYGGVHLAIIAGSDGETPVYHNSSRSKQKGA